MKIKNREELLHELAMLLKHFDKACNRYQTDVYLYTSPDGTCKLDTFVNVGGNSWLNDDHCTIYRDKEHLENHLDYYDTVEDLADVLGLTADELKVMTVQTIYDPEDGLSFQDMTWSDVYELIRNDEDLDTRIRKSYEDVLDCMDDNYYERAEEILSEYERDSENQIKEGWL